MKYGYYDTRAVREITAGWTEYPLWAGVQRISRGVFSYLYLYDAQGNVLAESDDDGSDYNGLISRFLTAGTYYFSVEPYDRSGDMEYEVSVSP